MVPFPHDRKREASPMLHLCNAAISSGDDGGVLYARLYVSVFRLWPKRGVAAANCAVHRRQLHSVRSRDARAKHHQHRHFRVRVFLGNDVCVRWLPLSHQRSDRRAKRSTQYFQERRDRPYRSPFRMAPRRHFDEGGPRRLLWSLEQRLSVFDPIMAQQGHDLRKFKG